MKASRALCALSASALLAATPLSAQDVAGTRVGITRASFTTERPRSAALNIAPSEARRHQRWPFVLGGAAVGASVAGLVLANSIRHNDDAMVFPQYVVAFVGIGAGIGALGGLVVSAVVR